MESTDNRSFSTLVEKFLGRPLPNSLADDINFPELPSEARDVILRMLTLMKRALYPATEFNPHMIRLLGTITPGMLPSAWGGRIPPVTSPGRHVKLDTYVSQRNWTPGNGQAVYIDLGCGFPPVTTADTAGFMPDWEVIGVDLSFARYVLYDADGQYACFNKEGEFLYFQPQMKPLHDNRESERVRFKSLFADLLPLLKTREGRTSQTVEKNGHKLVYDHIRDYERENLKFIESDIESLDVPPARVIRCMNVLLYFNKKVRAEMMSAIGQMLAKDGLLISGMNHPFGIYNRYAVYGRAGWGISPTEFAFSPDNLRPLGVGPWLTINDEDEEANLLADLTGAIRADKFFWQEFNQFVDELQVKYEICMRGEDGFNRFPEDALTEPPGVLQQKTTALWRDVDAEGYTNGAVDALTRAGYQAWKNSVGDIAVLPPQGSLPFK